jgi:hypothetical protein
MSAALLDDLLAAFMAPLAPAGKAPIPLRRQSYRREGSRTATTMLLRLDCDKQDSQIFARNLSAETNAGGEDTCGPSRASQNSHRHRPAMDEAASPDAQPLSRLTTDTVAVMDRSTRLMRRGWPEHGATRLAERLARHDHELDGRVSSANCGHRRYGNYKRAGPNATEIGSALASVLQRCPGHAPRKERT